MRAAAELMLAIGVCLLAAPPVRAQSAPEAVGPSLEWRAPVECPGREDVLAHVAALAQADDVRWTRFERIRAEVSRDGSRWLLRIEFIGPSGSPRREMTSGRCDELAEAAAVAIVLAHRSDAEPQGDFREETHALPPAAAAGTAQGPTAPRETTEASVAPAVPEAEGERASLALGVDALLDPTTLGSAAFGAGAGLELRLARLSTGLYGALFPAVETSLGAGQAVALGLWTSGARGCLRWGRALDTCAHFELGQLRAQGIGLRQASQGREPWAAPGLSAAFTSSPFDGFGVTTRISLYHPIVRGRYRVDESELVHRIPALTFRIALGFVVPLF
jgi:hypothetical protein